MASSTPAAPTTLSAEAHDLLSLSPTVTYDTYEDMVAANETLPPEMQFGEAQAISIGVYSVLFIISATLNLQVLKNLLRARWVSA